MRRNEWIICRNNRLQGRHASDPLRSQSSIQLKFKFLTNQFLCLFDSGPATLSLTTLAQDQDGLVLAVCEPTLELKFPEADFFNLPHPVPVTRNWSLRPIPRNYLKLILL